MLELLAAARDDDREDGEVNFFELIEKSCTSLKSMAPEDDADLSISDIFILGKLKIDVLFDIQIYYFCKFAIHLP